MFAEARAVGRQNLRGHLQCHASKGQESTLGHRPSCPIRKHCKPPLVDPSQRKACRGSQQSPTLTHPPATVDSKPLTETLSPLDATLTKSRREGSRLLLTRKSFECAAAQTSPSLLPIHHTAIPQSPLTTYYCQVPASRVYFHYVDFPPEERAALHLLYVLYGCVFWRGEA